MNAQLNCHLNHVEFFSEFVAVLCRLAPLRIEEEFLLLRKLLRTLMCTCCASCCVSCCASCCASRLRIKLHLLILLRILLRNQLLLTLTPRAYCAAAPHKREGSLNRF